MRPYLLSIILIALAGVFMPSLSLADTYKFVDKDGTTHLVDDVNKVPEEYRAAMEVWGKPLREPSDPSSPAREDSEKLLKNLTAEKASQTQAQAPETMLQKISKALDRPGLGIGLRIIIAVIVFIGAWLIISRVFENLGMQKAGSVVMIIVMGIATIVFLRVSAQKAADKVTAVMNEIKGVTKKLEGKAEAAKKIKAEFQEGEPARLMGMVEPPKTSDAELLKESGMAAMNPADQNAKEEKLTLTLPSFEKK